jgi:hypothetical protein
MQTIDAAGQTPVDPFTLKDDENIALVINADKHPAFVFFCKVRAIPVLALDALTECAKTAISHYSGEQRLYHSMVKYTDFIDVANKYGLNGDEFTKFLDDLTKSWMEPLIVLPEMNRPRVHLIGVPLTEFMKTSVFKHV